MEKAKIEVGLWQLEQAAEIVARIAAQHKFKKVSDSYWFGRTTQNVSQAFEKMSKVKNQLIEDYAQKDEKGFFKSGDQGIQIITEKKDEFAGKLKELYDLRETKDVFMIDLEALEGSEFTAQQITPLMAVWVKAPQEPEDPPGNTSGEAGPQNGKTEEISS
jgi:hypothetical protein